MSDRRRGSIRRATGVGAAIALLLTPTIARAQDAAEARAALVAGRVQHRVALAELDSLRLARTAVLDDSLRISGRVVRFPSAALPTNDRAWLVDGIEGAQMVLVERFGALAAGLVDTNAWEIQVARSDLLYRQVDLFAPLIDGRNIQLSGRRGIGADEVRSVALTAAGAQAVHRHSTLASYAGTMSFDDSPRPFIRAARNLALGNSSVGRRCVAGAVGACRVVLSPARGAPPLSVWYSREDHRSIVAASEMRFRRDSVGVRRREECLGGDDDVCDAIVTRLKITYPFRDDVRATFAAHAVLAGGEAGLARLDAARGRYADDPLALLVHVSGLTEERVIADWQRRISAAAAADAQPPVAPFAISAAFWCGLLLLGASRRRPR